MRSPAAAIAWALGRRHRWGLTAVVGYLAVLATYRLVILGPGQAASFDDSQSFAFAVLVPVSITFMYLLGVFSYGPAGDLASRQSVYPARMFTLPVTSAALAGWPMLYGTVAMALLWLAARLFAVWPAGFEPPLIWPAVLAAALLAWTQALTWMPYAVPGARVVVTLMLLVMLLVVVILALHHEASEVVMVALLAPHPAAAFLVARFAVARARRGDVPDWRGTLGWLEARPETPSRLQTANEAQSAAPEALEVDALRVRPSAATIRTSSQTSLRGGVPAAPLGWIWSLFSRARSRFASAFHAQVWFEWRRFGRSLPTLVGVLLPFELSMLFVSSETPSVVRATLLAVLLTPPFMAAFVAATVSRSSPEGSDSYELTPFMATRPVTSTELVAAKLMVAIPSTLASWLLVIVALPIALTLSGTSWIVLDDARRVVELNGAPRAVAMGGLGIFLLVLSTWKRLIGSVFIGVSGRAWLVKTSVFVTLAFLTLLVVLAPWILRREVIAEVLDALPWILAILASCKVLAAAWIAVRLHQIQLVGERTLIVGALCWDVAVLALFGLLVWLAPGLLFRVYGLALLAILAIPVVRLSGAPLALTWNRHR